MTNDDAARIAALERTMRRLSDRLDILELVARYTPAFDSSAADVVADAFVEDGVFDVGVMTCANRSEIRALARGDGRPEAMQRQFERGTGHVLSMPTVRINGDRAVATCTSQFYAKDDTAFTMTRLTAVRIELVRTADGWKIERRTNRLIDETGEGRALYRAGVAPD